MRWLVLAIWVVASDAVYPSNHGPINHLRKTIHSIMTCSDKILYDNSLGITLVLMLFFAFYFLFAKTPDKHIFRNYLRSRRLMAGALLTLSANYAAHLLVTPRLLWQEAAVVMNLSTYYITYLFFSCAFLTLLNPNYFTVKRIVRNIGGWLVYILLSAVALLCLHNNEGLLHVAMVIMTLWLISYGVFLSYRIIQTYHRMVRLFDETHSDDIAAYVRWMSLLTWWALIFGVGCSLLTFLPDRYVFLWILASAPFYIHIFCSYLNYLLFYEQVQHILESEMIAETDSSPDDIEALDECCPTYHADIKERLDRWMITAGYTQPGLTIENLAASLSTNRTYLSSYIKTVYNVSFREWISDMRVSYAKQLLANHPELTVAAISEASGFLSLSNFTKVFTKKTGCQPSKWRRDSI